MPTDQVEVYCRDCGKPVMIPRKEYDEVMWVLAGTPLENVKPWACYRCIMEEIDEPL